MRFYGQPNNEENDDESEKFFQDEEGFDEDMELENAEAFYRGNAEIKMTELALVEANLNRRILVSVIKMLEGSFFWKFIPFQTKLTMIEESYKLFSKLIAEEE